MSGHSEGSDGEVFDNLPFPYPNDRFPSNLAAVAQRTVLTGALPAREVVHDPEGGWLVGDGVTDPNEPGACLYGHMSHVVELNPSVAELATMPPGYLAKRSGVGQPWIVAELIGWGED